MEALDLIKVIIDNNLVRGFFERDFDYIDASQGMYEFLATLGIKNFEIVDERIDSSEFWAIIYFKDEDIYLKITGEYDSYGNGYHQYYSYITEVRPKVVEKIIYE